MKLSLPNDSDRTPHAPTPHPVPARLLLAAVCAIVLPFSLVAIAAEPGPRAVGKGYRLRRIENPVSGQASPPIIVNTTGPISDVVILGPDFDPARVDEIAVAGNGRVVAYATSISSAGLPGLTRDIVVESEGTADPVRYSDAAGDNDQPSVDFDSRGYRVCWRGSDGARGSTTGNIYVAEHTPPGPPVPDTTPTPDPTPVNITGLTATQTAPTFGTAFDPSLAARVRVREVGSGIKVRERDARVAFVSTGDLDRVGTRDGKNVGHIQQLFLWHERGDGNDADPYFEQITSIEDPTPLNKFDDTGIRVGRPSISGSGDAIAFECNADLKPTAEDPKDPSRVGNPSGVRQIYLWKRGSGIRQLTWSTGDCRAPRISRDGRFVVFCSKGEPIAGGNPEGNFEIFVATEGGPPSRRLRQLTQTAAGQNVLPRPTRTPRSCVFWSTSNLEPEFGATAQRGPRALRLRGGRVTLVHGYSDLDIAVGAASNAQRLLAGENPVFTGPPCPGFDDSRIHFATNDPVLNRKNADDDGDGKNGGKDPDTDDPLPDDRATDASLFSYHIARAFRRAQ